jgi:hypothetical protein
MTNSTLRIPAMAALACCAVTPMSDAQLATIAVGTEVRVSQTFPTRAFAELTACAHPSDPTRLLAAAMYDTVDSSGSRRSSVLVFASTDGGTSWKPTLDTRRDGQETPDPSCAISANGTAYLATMTVARQRGPISLYSSHDTGSSWAHSPLQVGNGSIDRPWVAVSDAAGSRDPHLYITAFRETRSPFTRDFVAFTLRDGTSDGLGGTAQRSHYLHNGPVVAIGESLAVGLLAHPTTRAQEPPTLAEPAGGWPSSPVISAVQLTGDTILSTPVVVSTFASETPSKRFLLTDFIPALARDRSSTTFRDRLYAVWLDAASGATRVMISHSSDSGRTWSPARLVGDDGSTSSSERPHDSVNPAVAASPQGVVGVLWYDRRDNPDFGYWPRFAASIDGGDTWTSSVKVSRRPMAARLDGLFAYTALRQSGGASNHELVFSVHNGWNFKGGDTSGLVAGADGVFHPFWIDNRTGEAQVWTAPVRVTGSVRRRRDITDSTTVRLDRVRYDSTARTISVEATVEMRAQARGPIVLVATSLTSGITDRLVVVGASNGIPGPGATWVVTQRDGLIERGSRFTIPLRFSMGSWTRAAINPLAVTVRVLSSETSNP